MDSLLTVNKLGYISGSGKMLIVYAESGLASRFLTYTEQAEIVQATIRGEDCYIPESDGDLRVEFTNPGQVTISWNNNSKGHQEATFPEIELVQYLDVDFVRNLVLNRQKKK